MIGIETQEQTIYIESWTLIDFALALEEAFYDGYEVSDKNEYAPIQIGGCYACTLVKTSLHDDPPLANAMVVKPTFLESFKEAVKGGVTSDEVVATVQADGETVVVNPIVEEDIIIPQLQSCVVQQDEVQSETQQETSIDVAEETTTETVVKPRGRKPSQK